jgi:hypothetical protein
MSELTAEPTPSASETPVQTLQSALLFFLEDDNMVDRFEADGLKTLILQDGQVTEAEKAFLHDAIQRNNFDSQALILLKDLLGRNPVVAPTE